MADPASAEERRRRLDALVDEASMLSFPASDPPAVFEEESEPIEGETTGAPVDREERAAGASDRTRR